MTPETISYIAGVVLSLLFAYLPGVKVWYNAQPTEKKALVMLIALAAASAGAFGISCLGWFSVPVTCDKAGALSLLELFVKAAIANQATFLLAVDPFKPKK